MVTRGEARAVRTPLNETGVGCVLSGDRSCGMGHDKIRFLENLFSTMSSFHDISDVYCMACRCRRYRRRQLRGSVILSPARNQSSRIRPSSSGIRSIMHSFTFYLMFLFSALCSQSSFNEQNDGKKSVAMSSIVLSSKVALALMTRRLERFKLNHRSITPPTLVESIRE